MPFKRHSWSTGNYDDMPIAESRARGAVSEIQHTVDNLNEWCEKNMRPNAKKCHAMNVCFGKVNLPPLHVSLANQTLDEVQSVKILGVTIQSNLKWEKNTQEMLNKQDSQVKIWKFVLN